MFKGFLPDAIDFLWGIRLNNRRDWFLEHKDIYQNALYAPMKALGDDLFARFSDEPGLGLHVSRIYKDARYSHGLPYKDSLWLSIRLDTDYWAQHPCLYFDLHPDFYGYGLAIVYPGSAVMQAFRDRISARPDEFLKLTAEAERATGFTLGGEHYSRPKPCADPRLAPYFGLKSLYCLTEKPVGPELYEPELAQTVGDSLRALLPLFHDWNNFAG